MKNVGMKNVGLASMASTTRTAPLGDLSKVAFDQMASAGIARVSREYLKSVAAQTAQMSRVIFSKIMGNASSVSPFAAGVSAGAAAVPAPNLEQLSLIHI